MSQAPLTPAEEPSPHPTQAQPDMPPSSLSYSEAFENDLMDAILMPSREQPSPPTSAYDQSLQIMLSHLPIPLDSPLRTHPSTFPGLRLTHPHGYHTGGLGPSPEATVAFAEKFIAENGIKRPEELKSMIDQAIDERAREVMGRMQKREAAFNANKKQQKEIARLQASRRDEERLAEKFRAEREEKRAKG